MVHDFFNQEFSNKFKEITGEKLVINEINRSVLSQNEVELNCDGQRMIINDSEFRKISRLMYYEYEDVDFIDSIFLTQWIDFIKNKFEIN